MSNSHAFDFLVHACVSSLLIAVVNTDQDIWLTGIFPFTGQDYDGGLSQRYGAQIMLDEINNHSTLLHGYKLRVVWQDGMCSKKVGTSVFYANLFEGKYYAWAPGVDEFSMDTNGDGLIATSETDPYNEVWDSTEVTPSPVGLLGPGCAGTAMNIAEVASLTRWPIVSHTATRPALSDRSTYPNFWRTIIPDTFFNAAWIALAKMLGQKSVATVIGETENWASMGDALVQAARAADVELVGLDLTSEIADFHGLQISIDSASAARDVVGELIRLKQRIVILLMFGTRSRLVLCEAYKQGFANAIYMVMGWLPYSWWSKSDTTCSASQITQMATGFIGANMMFWRHDMDTRLACSETMTAEAFRTKWFARQRKQVGDMTDSDAGHFLTAESATTADAVCMYAQMLHELLIVRSWSLNDLAARKIEVYSEIQEVFAATNFEGVQGRLRYGPGEADPKSSIILQQLQIQGGEAVIVDIASYTDGVFEFFGNNLIFQFAGETFRNIQANSTYSVDAFKDCPNQKLDMWLNRCESCPENRTFVESLKQCLCSAGYHSATTSSECMQCEGGSFSASPGATQCTKCSIGTYSQLGEQEEMSSCSLCPAGRFSNLTGLSECTSCNDHILGSTSARAAQSVTDCMCPQHTYKALGNFCKACPEGMTCDFGSAIESYLQPDNTGRRIYPKLEPRYWSYPSEPLSVFRCSNDDNCPG